MDFLGLKNLTIIESAIKIIKQTKRIEIDINKIPLDDELAYKLFQDGETTGVFQFESSGMKRYLKELKPTELEDIIAMVALYKIPACAGMTLLSIARETHPGRILLLMAEIRAVVFRFDLLFRLYRRLSAYA